MRPMFKYIQSIMNPGLVGVEIGVYRGFNAFEILHNMNIKKLYLIDSYKGYMGKDGIEYPDGESDVPGDNEKIPSMESAKKEAHKLINKNYKKNVVWIEKTSDEALAEIPDNLDFVYIDGNHNYEYVKADIENYVKKVRKGGILGGHDYIDNRHPGVKQAVNEFLAKNPKYKLVQQLQDWAIKC